MKSHQLFSSATPDLQQEIMNYLQKDTREAFRTALHQIGSQRKFRPQYFQSKTREQQSQWLLDHLKQKTYDGVAEQILQLWLLKAKTPMLVAFLDAADIKHDGNGQVDDLPDDFPAEKVNAGIDAMLKDNPGEHVATYLHVFQTQRPGGWPAITEALENNKDLKIGA